MKRYAAAAIVLGATLLLLPAAAAPAETTKHYQESVLEQGEKGVFSFELVPGKGGLMMGANTAELIIHDARDTDVPGASVTVTPWMPEHEHGISERPVIVDRGGGVYSIGNIIFTMTGRWELTVEARKGDRYDKAVFTYPAITAGGHHAGMMTAPEADLNTATTVTSEKELFTVGYESDIVPVPLNRLHRWTVSVLNPEGEPVSGAVIGVVGDMPEHGHGLPTKPETTGELPGGKYTVDGIRFTMPGWWVVTFHIMAGGDTDNASFNILVQ